MTPQLEERIEKEAYSQARECGFNDDAAEEVAERAYLVIDALKRPVTGPDIVAIVERCIRRVEDDMGDEVYE